MELVTFALAMIEIEIEFTERTTEQTDYDICVASEL